MKYKLSLALSICLMSNFALATDDVNLSEVTTYGNLSTTEGTGSYTTGNMSTATGLNLSIRETPQSVSVVSNQIIKDMNLNKAEDALSSYATGVSLNNDAGTDRIVSRGFYIDNIQEDGLASSISTSVFGPVGQTKEFTDLEFYDRIEVLRGVAGLTQSNGEPGGTVNLVRKRPSGEFGFNTSLSMGSWDNYRGMFDITNGLNKDSTIRGRLIGILGKTGSFKNYKNGYREAINGSLEFDITDKTLLTVGFLWQKTRGVRDIYGIPFFDKDGNRLNLDRKSYFGSNWDKTIYEKFNVYSELSHQFNDDLKAYIRANYTDSEGMTKFGAMGGNGSAYNGTNSHTIRRIKYDNDSKEFNLQAGFDGKYELFGQKHDFFINGSMSHEKFVTNRKWTPNQALSVYGIGIYNWSMSAIPEPDWDNRGILAEDYTQTTKINQRALSLGTRYNFTDTWHLLIGGRYARVEYDRYQHDYKFYPLYSGKRNSPKNTHFTPYAGLVWDFTKNLSWYVSYAEIFKPQTNETRDRKLLDPYVGYNLETGLKGEFLDGALNTSLAFFQVIQKNRPAVDPINTDYSIAEGKIRSRGIDAEIQGAINEHWNVFTGYTFNKSVYMETEQNNARTDYSKGADAKKYIPRHLLKLYTSYEIPIASQQKVVLGTGIRYQSKTASQYNTTYSNYVPAQKAYTLWDANVNYYINKNFNINLAVRNITDKKYFKNTQNRLAGQNNYYGDPRNFMLTLNYTY